MTTVAKASTFFNTPPFAGHNESYLPPNMMPSQALQVLSGPAIMILAAGLQVMKSKMTGTNKSELWSHIWKFISKAEARDKVGRIVQYFCRHLQGVVVHLPNSPLAPWKPVIAEVQSTLAWARRTNRWGKEMPHIPALAEAIKNGDPLEACQRAILITFLVQDHIYFLLKVGILKFEKYTAIQWHRRNLRFITLSHVFNFSLCIRDINRIREKQRLNDQKYSGSPQAAQKAEQDIFDNKKMMLRYVLTFIQMIHVSQVKSMDDTYIGLMGCVSSFIDASKQW